MTTLIEKLVATKRNLGHFITTPTGRSSTPKIQLLLLIYSYCKNKHDPSVTIRYSSLVKDFFSSPVSIRRHLASLEKDGWLTREVKHTHIGKKYYPNLLHIHLAEKTLSLIKNQ